MTHPDDETVDTKTGEVKRFYPIDPGDISLGQVDDLPLDVPTVPETAVCSVVNLFTEASDDEIELSGVQGLTGCMAPIW